MAKKHHAEEEGGESWLMSYCDMITLLVTFFLMMMTFSTSDKGDVKEVGVGLITGRGGIWSSSMGSSINDRLDETLVESMAEDLDYLVSSSGGGLGFRKALDGMTIQFDVDCSFEPGSTEPSAKLVESLVTVAKTIGRYEWLVLVEGSTDTAFQPTERCPDATTLGLARAQSAARVLLADPQLRRDRVQIASVGMDRPLSSNDSAIGRRTNRCVTLRVLSMSATRAGQRK